MIQIFLGLLLGVYFLYCLWCILFLRSKKITISKKALEEFFMFKE